MTPKDSVVVVPPPPSSRPNGLMRQSLGPMLALLLSACATAPATVTTYRSETVPVVSTMPMSDPVAQQVCAASDGTSAAERNGFCVVYEFEGQSFSVWLPQSPGESLTLQVPMSVPTQTVNQMPPAGHGYAVATSPWVYPSVFYFGTYYRTRPYAAPIRHLSPLPRHLPPRTPPHRH